MIRAQHGVIARRQLIELGLSDRSIKHRIHRGRLHRVRRGVYVAGRPEVTRDGELMAVVLACESAIALSGESAGEHWRIRPRTVDPIEITVRAGDRRSRPGIKIRRRELPAADLTVHRGIPVTTPTRTLVDLALFLDEQDLERAVNEADKLDLVDPEALREAFDRYAGVPGVRKLRRLLDRRTFTLTDSPLEQRFLPIAAKAGLGRPLTQQRVNGFRVDFFWPDLGLVVETDGLRYHRTPAQQARDQKRDQAHIAAGLTPLRFSHAQIRYEPERVAMTLAAVTKRLTGDG